MNYPIVEMGSNHTARASFKTSLLIDALRTQNSPIPISSPTSCSKLGTKTPSFFAVCTDVLSRRFSVALEISSVRIGRKKARAYIKFSCLEIQRGWMLDFSISPGLHHTLDKDNTGANAVNTQDMACHNTTGSTERH